MADFVGCGFASIRVHVCPTWDSIMTNSASVMVKVSGVVFHPGVTAVSNKLVAQLAQEIEIQSAEVTLAKAKGVFYLFSALIAITPISNSFVDALQSEGDMSRSKVFIDLIQLSVDCSVL